MTTLGVFRDDYINAANTLTEAAFNATTQASGTVYGAAILANATENYVTHTGQTTALAITTDTAANIVARLQSATQIALNASGATAAGTQGGFPPGVPNLINLTFEVQINNGNTAAGAITLSGGTGVTINTQSPAAIAVATSRIYICTVTGPASITMQQASLT